MFKTQNKNAVLTQTQNAKNKLPYMMHKCISKRHPYATDQIHKKHNSVNDWHGQ